MPHILSKGVLGIDIIFSYLYVLIATIIWANANITRWLTSFIFMAEDYDQSDYCEFVSPPFIPCSKKKAAQAFTFLVLYVTIFWWSVTYLHERPELTTLQLLHFLRRIPRGVDPLGISEGERHRAPSREARSWGRGWRTGLEPVLDSPTPAATGKPLNISIWSGTQLDLATMMTLVGLSTAGQKLGEDLWIAEAMITW